MSKIKYKEQQKNNKLTAYDLAEKNKEIDIEELEDE